MLLSKQTVVLGITGGIAAYKMPNVAHALVKLGADVHVLMTKNATEFISPLVFETLTRRRCQVDTFDRNFQYDVAISALPTRQIDAHRPGHGQRYRQAGPRPGG